MERVMVGWHRAEQTTTDHNRLEEECLDDSDGSKRGYDAKNGNAHGKRIFRPSLPDMG